MAPYSSDVLQKMCFIMRFKPQHFLAAGGDCAHLSSIAGYASIPNAAGNGCGLPSFSRFSRPSLAPLQPDGPFEAGST
jgi:hypothetical protein